MDFNEKPTYISCSNYALATHSSLEPPYNTTQMKSAMQKKKAAGRKKFQETRHPIYKGVRERNGKWVCELRQPQKKSRVWMGTFSCPEMAARAYDVAAFAFQGDSASLNFPETACPLPIAKPSSSAKDIECDDAMRDAEELSSFVEHSSSSCPGGLLSSEMEKEASTKMYFDEEELFNMPGILDSMAEGLMLTPPAMGKGFDWDDFDDSLELTLWS